MGAEDFLNNLMEQYSEENAEFVSVADVDEYGNVVFSNGVVEDRPQLLDIIDVVELTDGDFYEPDGLEVVDEVHDWSPEMVQHAINLIRPEVEE